MQIIEEVKYLDKFFHEEHIETSDGIKHNAASVIKMADHYSESLYLGDQTDSLGRLKPFYNIVNFRVTLAKVATDLDLKDIQIEPTDADDTIRALLLKKKGFKWAKTTKYSQGLNERGYHRAKYGLAVAKKRIEGGELYIDTVNVNNLVFDPADFEGGVKIEKHYMTPVQLQAKEGVWENVDYVLEEEAKKKEKEGDKQFTVDRIEVWEVTGQFPKLCMQEACNEEMTADYYRHTMQRYFIAIDCEEVMYCEDDAEDPYRALPWEPVANRALGRGVIEESKQAQMWTNDAVISEKNAMDISTKIAMKTNSTNIGDNVLTMDNGKVFELDDNEDINPINFTAAGLGQIDNVIARWDQSASRNNSSVGPQIGERTPANTTYSETALLNEVSSRPFDYRRNEAIAFEVGLWEEWVIPHLVKGLEKDGILASNYTAKELEVIDGAFGNVITSEYVAEQVKQGLPVDVNRMEALRRDAIKELQSTGERRYLPIPKGYFKGIETDVNFVTNDLRNKQAALASLSSVMRDVSNTYNPQTGTFAMLEDPTLREIFGEILEVAQLPISSAAILGAEPTPRPQPVTPVPNA